MLSPEALRLCHLMLLCLPLAPHHPGHPAPLWNLVASPAPGGSYVAVDANKTNSIFVPWSSHAGTFGQL